MPFWRRGHSPPPPSATSRPVSAQVPGMPNFIYSYFLYIYVKWRIIANGLYTSNNRNLGLTSYITTKIRKALSAPLDTPSACLHTLFLLHETGFLFLLLILGPTKDAEKTEIFIYIYSHRAITFSLCCRFLPWLLAKYCRNLAWRRSIHLQRLRLA